MTALLALRVTATGRRRRPSLLGRRPELPALALALAGWVALLTAPTAPDARHPTVFSWTGLAMLAAMTATMAPQAIAGARTAAFGSGWWRSGRAGVQFLAGNLSCWLLIAYLLAPLGGALAVTVGAGPAAAAVLLGCAALELTPGHRRRSAACDRPMRLHSRGVEPAADCVRFGVRSALRAGPVCGPAMLAMLCWPSNLALMASTVAVALLDRVTEARCRIPVAGAYLAIASAVVLGVWS